MIELESELYSNGINTLDSDLNSECSISSGLDKKRELGGLTCTEVKDDKLKLYCRIRPYEGVNKNLFKSTETSTHTLTVNTSSLINKKINVGQIGNKFSFDYIFDEEYTQLEVFQETCLGLINDLVEKKQSSLLFAQGIPNSGKTYTVVGDIENPGILPLCLRLVHDQVKEKKSPMIKIFCNYLEIYDEHCYDLLSLNESKVKINNNINLNEIKEAVHYKLDTIKDFSNALNIGNKKKKMEGPHSKSYTIFKIILRFYESSKFDRYQEASITIVDFAFPLDHSFINLAAFKFYKEVKNIPTKHDLYSLHRTFLIPVSSNQIKSQGVLMGHSMLTMLFKYYVSGDEKIVLITNLHPGSEYVEENLKVLQFSKKFKSFVEQVGQSAMKKTHKVRTYTTNPFEKSQYHNNNINTQEIVGKNNTNIEQPNQKLKTLTTVIHKKVEKVIETPRKNNANLVINKPAVCASNGERNITEDEFTQMKKNYENLMAMFEEQQKLINSILVNQNNVLKNSIDRIEKNSEITKTRSDSLPGNINIPEHKNRKLFNIYILNPTIENMNLMHQNGEKNSDLKETETDPTEDFKISIDKDADSFKKQHVNIIDDKSEKKSRRICMNNYNKNKV